MRKLASIQKIVSLSPIEGADKILKATILGWECVVLKNEFKEGDLCVYCEVDSILPEKAEFEFLRERKFRIKTIKLKGQVSQGICFPLSILPKGNYNEGDNITDIIGVTKYDPQAAFEQKEFEKRKAISKNRLNKFFGRYKWYRQMFFKPARLPFPDFIKKTDEDRIQLFPDICERYTGVLFSATEKLDGTSCTAFSITNPRKWQFWKPYIFGICSRNYHLIRNDNSVYWQIIKKLQIENKIKELRSVLCLKKERIIIQGEIIGSKVQNNKYDIEELNLYVFNIFEDDNWLNESMLRSYCYLIRLEPVPLLYLNKPLASTIPECINLAKGESTISDIPREGIVVRNYEIGISFKIINPDFLLKFSE